MLDIMKLKLLTEKFEPTRSLKKETEKHPLYPAIPYIVDLRLKDASWRLIADIITESGLKMGPTAISDYMARKDVHSFIKEKCSQWRGIRDLDDKEIKVDMNSGVENKSRSLGEAVMKIKQRSAQQAEEEKEETVSIIGIDNPEPFPEEEYSGWFIPWQEFLSETAKANSVPQSQVSEVIGQLGVLTKKNGKFKVAKPEYFKDAEVGDSVNFSTIKVAASLIKAVSENL